MLGRRGESGTGRFVDLGKVAWENKSWQCPHGTSTQLHGGFTVVVVGTCASGESEEGY